MDEANPNIKFVNTVTHIPAIWANTVGDLVWEVFQRASTVAEARAALNLGTLASQDSDAVVITGGSIDDTVIGLTTPQLAVFQLASSLREPVTNVHVVNKAYLDKRLAALLQQVTDLIGEIPTSTGTGSAAPPWIYVPVVPGTTPAPVPPLPVPPGPAPGPTPGPMPGPTPGPSPTPGPTPAPGPAPLKDPIEYLRYRLPFEPGYILPLPVFGAPLKTNFLYLLPWESGYVPKVNASAVVVPENAVRKFPWEP